MKRQVQQLMWSHSARKPSPLKTGCLARLHTHSHAGVCHLFTSLSPLLPFSDLRPLHWGTDISQTHHCSPSAVHLLNFFPSPGLPDLCLPVQCYPSSATLLQRWPSNTLKPSWFFPKQVKSLSAEVCIISSPKICWMPAAYQVKMKVKSLSHVWLFATPWTVAYQASPSMGFSRQEYQSGLPFPPPGDLPDPGIEPRSPALQEDALPSEPPGKPR